MIAALPLAGIALVYLLGCDGHAECGTSASYAGFSSVSQYMWTNCIWWLFLGPLGQILEIPPQLITCNCVMELVPDGKYRWISGTCLCAMVLYLCDCIMLTQRAILTVTMAKFSPWWLCALVVSVLLDFWLVWFLFFQKQLHPTQRALVRSPVYVQLWEWNYVDIAKECTRYLGPNGIKAVQISPVTEHILGSEWYTKYQPIGFGLHSRSGSRQQLAEMIATCRTAGVQAIDA
eukprot:s1668_g4.t1